MGNQILINKKKLKDLYGSGLSILDISKSMGVSAATVKRRIKKWNLKRPKGYKPKPPKITKKNITSKIKHMSKDRMEDMYIREKMSQSKIARELGVSRRTVIYYLKKFNIPTRGHSDTKRVYDSIDIKRLKHLYFEKNLSIEKCAEKMGVSGTVIRKAAKKHNIKFRSSTDHHFLDVPEEAIQMYKDGKTSTEIAEETGVDYKTILRRIKTLGIPVKNSGEYSSRVSKGEQELKDFISSLGVNFESNSRKVIDGYELDIYVKGKNLGVEYNGLYWHSEEMKGRRYHFNKMKKASESGVDLIQVWEHDWKFRKDIVKSIIKQRLGFGNKIYARKCSIEELDNATAKEFCNKNHLQGGIDSNIALGLIYEGDLVLLMSFKRTHDNNFEISRLCTSGGNYVVGGANRLFKHFIKTENPDNIISYCDLCYFSGNVYGNLGMKKESTTDPGYFYFNNRLEVINRRKVQKHKLVKMGFGKNMSEIEIMKSQGYNRFFNAGNHKYSYRVKE